MLEEQEKLNAEIMKMGGYQAAEIGKNSSKFTVNPIEMMKPYLYPYQQYMFIAAKGLRFVKRIIAWQVRAL